MRSVRFLVLAACFAPLVVACGSSPAAAPTVDVSGPWSGTLSSSRLGSPGADLMLAQTAGNVSGQWRLRSGAAGTFSATVSANNVLFTLTETTPMCPGTFKGTALVTGNSMTVTFTGTDCLGNHQAGGGTLTRPDPATSVMGTAIDTHFTDRGEVALPRDVTGVFEAIWAESNGTFTKRPVTGSALGTFSIANVPPGTYFLRQGTTYYVTSARTVDLSGARFGRPEVGLAPENTTLSLSGANLAAWQENDDLQLVSTHAGVAESVVNFFQPQIEAGDTSIAGMAVDWTGGGLVDAVLGDTAIVTHLVAKQSDGGRFYQAVGQYMALSPFTMTLGGNTTIDGSFEDVPQTLNASFELRGAPWESMRTAAGESAQTISRTLFVVALPGADTRGLYTTSLPELVVLDAGTGPGDMTTGVVSFGNPYPASWSLIGSTQVAYMTQYAIPGSQRGTRMTATASRTDLVSALVSEAITPLVGPVGDLKVNGAAGTTAVTGSGLTPTLSWAQPAVGTAHFYAISVTHIDVSASRPVRSIVANIFTANKNVQIPPDVMQPGERYIFTVTARHMPGADLEKKPLKRALPSGAADALSGLVTP